MKILIINGGALPVPSVKGGAVETLVDHALKDCSISSEFDITVFSVYDNLALQNVGKYNIEFKFINEGFWYKIGKIIRAIINRLNIIYIGNQYISTIYKIMKKENLYYDKIIVENSPRFALILKHQFSDKIILHLHNDYLNTSEKFSKQIVDEYDEIYCNSNFVIREVNKIMPQNKTKLLYNGIDLTRFTKNKNKNNLRKKYNITEQDKVFVYSGRIVPEKGVLELIKAFLKLNDNHSKLLIVGDITNKKNHFIEEIKYLSVDNHNIIFTGYVSQDKINEIYSMCDFGVVPSKCNEAFGLSAAEFLAVGLPVIYSNDGALDEVVDLSCGLDVDKLNLEKTLVEKMEMAIHLSDAEYQVKSKNARNKAKQFSLKKYIDGYHSMLK